jgi:hypothetical protein
VVVSVACSSLPWTAAIIGSGGVLMVTMVAEDFGDLEVVFFMIWKSNEDTGYNNVTRILGA